MAYDNCFWEEEDEGDERERVEGAIAEQRPPGQVQHRLGEESAHSDDKLKGNRIRCFLAVTAMLTKMD